MGNDAGWWGRFWEDGERTGPGRSRALDEATWFGQIWTVALEDLRDSLERLAPGRRLLECGCGSARASRFLARAGFDCTMMDYSLPALRLAAAGFAADGLPGRFAAGDILALSFREGSFDAVHSGGVLEFFADIKAPIREMVRVLRPGGVFSATIVPRKFSAQTVADWERTAARFSAHALRGDVRGAFGRIRSIPAEYRLNAASLEDYAEACRQAGLGAVTGRCATPFPELALPPFAEAWYARLMGRARPAWRRFNRSGGRWARIWGLTYVLTGTKGGRAS